MTGDFKEFFDLRRLDRQQLGEIEFVLNSPAYEHSFKPYILGILKSLNTLWKDRTRERRDKYTDDFLAGGDALGSGLLEFFALLIQETSFERMHEAMQDKSPESQYQTRLHAGAVRPVVGLDQSALPEPVDPDEDF